MPVQTRSKTLFDNHYTRSGKSYGKNSAANNRKNTVKEMITNNQPDLLYRAIGSKDDIEPWCHIDQPGNIHYTHGFSVFHYLKYAETFGGKSLGALISSDAKITNNLYEIRSNELEVRIHLYDNGTVKCVEYEECMWYLDENDVLRKRIKSYYVTDTDDKLLENHRSFELLNGRTYLSTQYHFDSHFKPVWKGFYNRSQKYNPEKPFWNLFDASHETI